MSGTKKLLVYGASGHGKVVADAAIASGWEVLGFADDDTQKLEQTFFDYRVRVSGAEETANYAKESGAQLVVAIGDNSTRKRISEALMAHGAEMATVVHPEAAVAASASIDIGTVVFAGCVVNADTKIGKNVIINTSASIDHDSVIADHVHISPGASLGGTVSVGEGTHIGIGSTVRNNSSIGEWSICGAGSVVVADIPDRVVAYGVPAKIVTENIHA